jgi:outer membrane protein OmpA-like peptidoglycan-associated protein
VGAALRKIPRLIVPIALSAVLAAAQAQPQIAHVDFADPEATPETVTDQADFPFLLPMTGTSLVKTTHVNEPLEVKPASADNEAMLAGLSFVEKTYSAPVNVWNEAFITLYRDALILHGWRIVDQPPPAATEGEPHVINLAAHYAANGRDLYAQISRAPEGGYEIRVADVGAEDWGGILDRVCRFPIFSVHFKHDLTLDYEDSRPAFEKLAAVIRSRPQAKFQVQGHTDNGGDEKELMTLSLRRASLVNTALIKAGAPENRLSFFGYGKSRPLLPNDTDWGRTKNRRIEIEKQGCTVKPTGTDTPRRPGA